MERTFTEATIQRWVDGDTAIISLDLGFRVNFTEKFRLAGINTPEKAQPGYQEAITRVNELAPPGTPVTVVCHGYDRYDRWISKITTKDGKFVNQILLDEGLAKVY